MAQPIYFCALMLLAGQKYTETVRNKFQVWEKSGWFGGGDFCGSGWVSTWSRDVQTTYDLCWGCVKRANGLRILSVSRAASELWFPTVKIACFSTWNSILSGNYKDAHKVWEKYPRTLKFSCILARGHFYFCWNNMRSDDALCARPR